MNAVKYFFGTLMLAVALYYASLALPFKITWKNGTNDNGSLSTGQFARLDWQKYSDAALAKAAQDGKPVIIDFSAEWCLACHELEAYTFSDAIVGAASKDFVLLKFDATEDSPELDILKKKYGILGLPTILFFDRKGEWKSDQTLTGFEKAPEFLKRMHAVM
jgi:thiol:disulfide interchange protein DsbD